MPKYRKIYKGARNLKIMTLSRKVLRVDGKKSIPGVVVQIIQTFFFIQMELDDLLKKFISFPEQGTELNQDIGY